MRRFENGPYVKTALVMYAAYLAPYIIVSYYVRYSIPLAQVKLLFIFWAADLWFSDSQSSSLCDAPRALKGMACFVHYMYTFAKQYSCQRAYRE